MPNALCLYVRMYVSAHLSAVVPFEQLLVWCCPLCDGQVQQWTLVEGLAHPGAPSQHRTAPRGPTRGRRRRGRGRRRTRGGKRTGRTSEEPLWEGEEGGRAMGPVMPDRTQVVHTLSSVCFCMMTDIATNIVWGPIYANVICKFHEWRVITKLKAQNCGSGVGYSLQRNSWTQKQKETLCFYNHKNCPTNLELAWYYIHFTSSKPCSLKNWCHTYMHQIGVSTTRPTFMPVNTSESLWMRRTQNTLACLDSIIIAFQLVSCSRWHDNTTSSCPYWTHKLTMSSLVLVHWTHWLCFLIQCESKLFGLLRIQVPFDLQLLELRMTVEKEELFKADYTKQASNVC